MMIKGANVVILFLFSRYFQKKTKIQLFCNHISALADVVFTVHKRGNSMTFNPWMFVIHPVDVP